jgi:hypothetical protein
MQGYPLKDLEECVDTNFYSPHSLTSEILVSMFCFVFNFKCFSNTIQKFITWLPRDLKGLFCHISSQDS